MVETRHHQLIDGAKVDMPLKSVKSKSTGEVSLGDLEKRWAEKSAVKV